MNTSRLILAAALLSGCASIQYRHDLPQTVVHISAAPADVHTKIARTVSGWGWKIEANDRDSRLIEARDPNQQPGFFAYWLKYHFTYEPEGEGTRLNVRAAILADDGQDYSGGGSTIPAKESERRVAENIKAICEGQ